MGKPQSKEKKSNSPNEELEMTTKKKFKKPKEKDKSGKWIKAGSMTNDSARPSSAVNVPQNITKDHYELWAVNECRKALQCNFSSFILNQMLLSVQFYEHYERDKAGAKDFCLKMEKQMNEKLEKYSVLLPNVLDEAVGKHVRFQMKHGSTKTQLSNLHLKTIYVVFENIEISKQYESNYDVLSPTCKVYIDTENIQDEKDREKMWKGYVKLKLGQTTKNRFSLRNLKLMKNSSDCNKIGIDASLEESGTIKDSNDENRSELVDEQLYEYHSLDFRSSSSSYTYSSCTTYDYSYINNLNSHQPLSDLLSTELNGHQGILPEDCISNVFISTNESFKSSDSNSSDSEDSEMESNSDEDLNSDTDSDKIIQVRYLNSKMFLRYFATLLKESLAAELNVSKTELEGATWKGAAVYTQLCELTPALYFPYWPACAFEWKDRRRKIHRNPYNGESIQWPTTEMIKTVTSFGCHAVPVGYVSKKDRNPSKDIEWKIVFPEADRYLESNLSAAQVKVYMLCKLLIKTYLEPEQENSIAMFSLDHLRAHLFWSCEDNYAAWPEEFLGDVLLRFLRSFLHRLSSKYLPDYFICERNLFESIPESNLVRLHQTISQIIQNPVMHIMMAYRNLFFEKDFYPRLNYKKLYACIIVENPLELVKKMGTSIKDKISIVEKIEDEKKENIQQEEDENKYQEGLIGYSYHKEMKSRLKRRKTKRLKRQEKLKLQKKLEAEQMRRNSEDSIDLHFIIKEAASNTANSVKNTLRSTTDDVRQALIIEVFIGNFISMAKSAYKLMSVDQCRIYLNQSGRLCVLLREYHYDELAKHFIDKIAKIRRTLETVKVSEINCTGPALPSRTNLEKVRSLRGNKKSIVRFNTTETTIDTPKTVQFDDDPNFVEPRSFFEIDAAKHAKREDVKPAGILRQTNFENLESNIESKIIGVRKKRGIKKRDEEEEHCSTEF